MLKPVSGDLLLSSAQALAHGVAPGDHFNQGLALALRQAYPSMARDFRHYCQLEHPKAGDVWCWSGADGRRIVNLMTQDPARSDHSHPGKATTHNVNVALRNLRKLIEAEGFTSLALPKIATGVGGLSWDDVFVLVERHLGDLDIPVYVYTQYEPGVSAAE